MPIGGNEEFIDDLLHGKRNSIHPIADYISGSIRHIRNSKTRTSGSVLNVERQRRTNEGMDDLALRQSPYGANDNGQIT